MAGKVYLGQGTKHPHEINVFGRISLESGTDLIKQSLDVLFNMPVGTEFFREHVGSQIREAMFEPNDAVTKSLLDYYIADGIQRWERRILLVDIEYDFPENEPSLIRVAIFFQVKQASEIDSYIFPFYRQLKN